MTKYIEALNVGDSVKMEGPKGKCVYKMNGLHFRTT